MKRKRDDLEDVGTKNASEKQLRAVAKAAFKKADRFWRLAEKASSENYKEFHVKPAQKQRLKKRAEPMKFEQKRMEKPQHPIHGLGRES